MSNRSTAPKHFAHPVAAMCLFLLSLCVISISPVLAKPKLPSIKDLQSSSQAYVLAQFTPVSSETEFLDHVKSVAYLIDIERLDATGNSQPISVPLATRKMPKGWESPCKHDTIMFGPDRTVAVLFSPLDPGTYRILRYTATKITTRQIPLEMYKWYEIKRTLSVPLQVDFTVAPGKVNYIGSFLMEDLSGYSEAEVWVRCEPLDNLPTVLDLLDQWQKGLGKAVEHLITKADYLAAPYFTDFQWRGIPWWRSIPLLRAAERGDAEAIESELNEGAYVQVRDDLGRTPLHLAAASGVPLAVELLLARGADVNAKDEPKESGRERLPDYLMQYFEKMRPEGVPKTLSSARLLTRRDAGLDETGEATALHRAAYRGHLAIVQLLLDKGAMVDAEDFEGQTPLQRALAQGHAEVADLLVSRGASLDHVARGNWTMLHAAAAGGLITWVGRLLDKGADVSATTAEGKTPLHWAAYRGYKDLALLLIDKGADVNASDVNGKTALLLAVAGDKEEVALALIERHADVNTPDRDGHTPLMDAVQAGLTDVAVVLVKNGADVNAACAGGWTPLMWAEDKSVAILLIDAGANVNARDDDGDTPLHHAVLRPSRPYLVEVLLFRGADVNAKNSEGKTPLGIADERPEYKEIAKLLRDHGGTK